MGWETTAENGLHVVGKVEIKRDEARIGSKRRVSCGRMWPAIRAVMACLDRQIGHDGEICHAAPVTRL